jgi:hypothetical protein
VTTLFYVLLIIVALVVQYHLDQEAQIKKEKQEREEAKVKFSKALTQAGISHLVAYGRFGGPETGLVGNLEAHLVRLETEKWNAMNAGRLLTKALLASRSLTTSFQADGSVTLEMAKGSDLPPDFNLTVLPDPFTLKDFRLAWPNPDTAILSYKAVSGFAAINATTVWTRKDGNWATVSYQAAKGSAL